MELTILPGLRQGRISAPVSKSHAHRLLICAALGFEPVSIQCGTISADIAATVNCLGSLGARVRETASGTLEVIPGSLPETGLFPCGESGSTLRFLLPVCGALGMTGRFILNGCLPDRPLHPLDSVLEAQGMDIRRNGNTLTAGGRLRSGEYRIPGNISSQFVTGLLLALPLLDGDSILTVEGPLESAGYVDMTESVLRQAHIRFEREGQVYRIPGGQRYALPSACAAERDWSGAAFFLAMGAFSPCGIRVDHLPAETMQGDAAMASLLRQFGAETHWDGSTFSVRKGSLRGCAVDAASIPDLVPALAVLAAGAEGETRIYHASRLRLKESDRLDAIGKMLHGLGCEVDVQPDLLCIRGQNRLRSGYVDSFGDHRIAMAAASAAVLCSEPLIITKPECVGKSFPRFWECYHGLERTI